MCTSPLWIRNRRYYKRGITFEEIAVQLAEHPGDLARQRLLVPCGKCEECLRDERNAWYVHLERELARCRDEGRQAVFVTITISPKLYAVAVQFPSAFVLLVSLSDNNICIEARIRVARPARRAYRLLLFYAKRMPSFRILRRWRVP